MVGKKAMRSITMIGNMTRKRNTIDLDEDSEIVWIPLKPLIPMTPP